MKATMALFIGASLSDATPRSGAGDELPNAYVPLLSTSAVRSDGSDHKPRRCAIAAASRPYSGEPFGAYFTYTHAAAASPSRT